MTRRAWSSASGRALLATIAAAAVLLIAPATAAADPAGPTDYESEIVAVVPPLDTVELSIAGGDSFVVVDVERGTEVVVIGNQGEHYLRIDPDGQVWENRRSPDTYANVERYGIGSLPPQADASAEPEWRRVGSGGTWAWHDHRAHRMDPFPPLNVERGEVVLDAVVPLLVDGTEVDVRVSSVWMPAPSPWPGVVGVALGLAAVLLLRRRPAIALAVVSAAALAVGVVQFRSLPAATDPLWLWWLAPLVGLIAAIVAVVLGHRSSNRREHDTIPELSTIGAVTISALQLLVWSWERRSGLYRAILPTDAPFWFDRLVTGAAISAGLAAMVVVTVSLVASFRVSAPAPARSPG